MASVAVDDRGRGVYDHATRLFEEHSEWVVSYCRRQLGDRVEAEDVAQTTFLHAFRALRRGVVPECERAWLTTIARNACHTHWRSSQRRPETADLDLDRIALARPDVEEAGFMDEVRAALASLPENQRRALVLREWQGISSNEIASELRLSEPATHALLFRACRSFATAMSASRRPLAGLNVAAVLDQLRCWLKPILGGAGSKAALVTTAAGVAVGGVVLDERIDRGAPSPAAPPASSDAVVLPASAVSPVWSTTSRREANPRRKARSTSDEPQAKGSAKPSTSGVLGAPRDEAVVRLRRPPREVAAPAELSPPRAETPDPPALPAPGLPDVPVPAPPDPPPILRDPPVELPPPIEELVQPVEAPALSTAGAFASLIADGP